jgi:hypothetical protein
MIQMQTVSSTPITNTNSILLPTFCPPLSLPPPPPPVSSLPPTPSSILSTPSLLVNGFHSTDSQSNIISNDSSQILTNESLPPPPPPAPSPSNGVTNKSKSRSKNSKTTNEKSPSNQSRHSSTNPLMKPYELPKISLPSI